MRQRPVREGSFDPATCAFAADETLYPMRVAARAGPKPLPRLRGYGRRPGRAHTRLVWARPRLSASSPKAWLRDWLSRMRRGRATMARSGC